MAHPFWPLFDLRIRTPRLELRVPTDDDFPGLLAAIDAGIHDPDTMPFFVAWTDAEPVARARGAVQWWWRARAEWTAERWNLALAVFLDGVVIGMQDLLAEHFPVRRTVVTGSWLTQRRQGQGFGKEMRAGVLELAFRGLGAEVAESGAFVDNAASLGVSRSLGYEPNGVRREVSRGVARELQQLRLPRERWRCPYAVEIEGLDGSLPLFGLG